jgi:hypothetical protein
MSEQERVLRMAIGELHKVGLEIAELACRAQTLLKLCEEESFKFPKTYFKQGRGYGRAFYCGIPIKKDQSVALPEK